MTPGAVVRQFTHTKKSLVVVLGLMNAHDLPEGHVHIHGDGQNITLDYSGNLHPGRDVRYAAACLGMVADERPIDLPDGTAGVEHRAQSYDDGILLTVRAAVPVRALWPVP